MVAPSSHCKHSECISVKHIVLLKCYASPAACMMEEGQELVASVPSSRSRPGPEPPRPGSAMPGSVEGLRQRTKSQLSRILARANSYTWPRNHHITCAHTLWMRGRVIPDTHTHWPPEQPGPQCHFERTACSQHLLLTKPSYPPTPLPGSTSELCPPPRPQLS